MELFEFLTAAMVTVVLPLAFLKMIFDYKREKMALKEQSDSKGPELTTSELEALVRRAVEEAAAPLEAKVGRLERRVEEKIPRRIEPPEGVHRFGLLADADTLREETEHQA